MNTFKRKALASAMLAGLGVAGTAEAVYHDVNGVGQVLVYPYYTVQSLGGNAFNTYISVVNTTSRAKVVKVRFREGKTSAEVLDFNLYLSANDVWTGAIIPADSTATAPGRLVTADVSCTNPPIPATGVDFRNFLYTSGADALPGTGLERTREGYFEIIDMGTLTGAAATAVTHVNGVPANCAAVQGQVVTLNSVEAPTGGLSGTGTLINVNNGQDFTYNPDALAEFRVASFYTDIANDAPNLSSADPTSIVVNTGTLTTAGTPAGATVYRSDWTAGASLGTAGARAVAAVYMHTAVMNEYVLDNATQSNTDWVVTMPVKRFFVNSTTAGQPFTNVLAAGGACETVGFSFFNREERGAAATSVDFSPAPPAGSPNSLCWESTVIAIRNGAAHMPAATATTVLGSVNLTNINVTSTFQNGWGILQFTGAGATGGMGSAVTSDRSSLGGLAIAAGTSGAQTFFGLPVTGFMVRTFRNGNLSCGTATCQGNYGGLFQHAYRTAIAP